LGGGGKATALRRKKRFLKGKTERKKGVYFVTGPVKKRVKQITEPWAGGKGKKTGKKQAAR